MAQQGQYNCTGLWCGASFLFLKASLRKWKKFINMEKIEYFIVQKNIISLSKILVKFRVLRASKNANLFPVSKNLKYSSDSLTGNGFPFEGFPAMPPHFQVPDCEAI